MGTRGFITFVIDGSEKTVYNHFDSYPEGLGADCLRWLRSVLGADVEAVADQARALAPVPDREPTDAEVDRLRQYINRNVGDQSVRDWYCLLRETQGDPAAILQAGLYEDAGSFPADSLMAEWGYVVDFDTQVFEVYEGFQTAAHSEGRFTSRPIESYSIDTQYYPVRLVASWKFGELPTDDEFLSTFAADDEED